MLRATDTDFNERVEPHAPLYAEIFYISRLSQDVLKM